MPWGTNTAPPWFEMIDPRSGDETYPEWQREHIIKKIDNSTKKNLRQALTDINSMVTDLNEEV